MPKPKKPAPAAPASKKTSAKAAKPVDKITAVIKSTTKKIKEAVSTPEPAKAAKKKAPAKVAAAPVKTKAPGKTKIAPTPATKPARNTKSAPKSARKKAVEITNEQIAERAYYIGERRQNENLPGDPSTDWIEAEKVLRAEAGMD